MSGRLPSLLKRTTQSGLKRRSYATQHQQQDHTPPSGSSVPLIVAGLVGVGALVYYNQNRGNKNPDPSDTSGQKVQKKADKAISERTDAAGNVYPKDAPPDTVINENTQQSSHPVATKRAAYVDPKQEK